MIATLHLTHTRPPLSLNDRGGSRGAVFARAAKVRQLREEVFALAYWVGLPKGLDHIVVQLHYRPRDNRRRDTDNLIATLKPICDALAAGTTTSPGYGVVADDIPQFMAKPEPIIHSAERGKPGALWVDITWED